MASQLSGDWLSGPVILDRGDFSETYIFALSIGGDTPVMDLTYTQGDDLSTTRVIRQGLAVQVSQQEILLIGSKPQLVSGPEIIGVYEPDTLNCAPLAVSDPDTLYCGWGSPAHGAGPQVELTRRSNG